VDQYPGTLGLAGMAVRELLDGSAIRYCQDGLAGVSAAKWCSRSRDAEEEESVSEASRPGWERESKAKGAGI
jgi:hypothetical protein